MKRQLSVLILLSLLVCALAGCAPAAPRDTTLFLMDTVMELRVYDDDSGAVTDALRTLLEDLDADLDPRDPSGALGTLNRNGTVENRTVAELLAYAQELSGQTGGALDVTLLPLSRLWGFGEDSYVIPIAEKITETKKRTGMDKISVAGDLVTLSGTAEVDLGSLAKGYAADLCRDLLERNGKSGILSLGGNVQTVGSKPDRQPWTVGIQDPDGTADYVLTLSVRGSKALVTSGDYQRYFEYEGVRYCHILDPETGAPVQGDLRSVTVVADSALLADGLSTALFVMGLDRAVEFWRANPDSFEAVFITDDGRILLTGGIADSAGGQVFEVIEP